MKPIIAASAFVAMVAASTASARDDALEDATYNRAAQVAAVLNGTMEPGDVFAPAFLAAVPAERLMAIKDQLVSANGAITGVDEVDYKGSGAAEFDVVFERARGRATLQVLAEAPYLVSGFRITEIVPVDDSPVKIMQEISALPGNATIGVFMLSGENGPQSVLTHKPTQQFAIGSAFKLYVLSALVQEIKAGRHRWDEVVPLDAPSLPSGQMQDWPIGTPVTLQTLATMMISISDNTATDVLIRLLGRERIEAELAASGHAEPQEATPFLTTVEAFALKAGDPARLAAYAAADPAGRRSLLDQNAADLVADRIELSRLGSGKPSAIDSVEWFASSNDIAQIFQRLRDAGDRTALDILAINPGIARAAAEKWPYLGYKGGSEPGVINLSWLLRDAKDRWFVVTASWNDPAGAVDEAKFVGIAGRAIAMLAKGGD